MTKWKINKLEDSPVPHETKTARFIDEHERLIKIMRKPIKDEDQPKIVLDSIPASQQLAMMDLSDIEVRVMATMGGRGSGKCPNYFVFDEASYIQRWDIEYDSEIENRDGPKGVYWTQPIPVKGAETSPSNSKRAKLRAKRKKRK